MKVAIINYTGTVGKTTIAAHLLSPRLGDAPIYAIETINETAEGLGLEIEKFKGEKFRDLFKKLMLDDTAIIDVGASNVEEFLDGMTRFEDSHAEMDYFIVPVTSGAKEQKESMKMIATLAEFGIPQEKIRVVFNRVMSDVEDEFKPLLTFAKKEKSCIANTDAVIYEHELFDLLAVKKITISAALADETDYKAKAREEKANGGDTKKITYYQDMHTIKLGAKALNRNLDAVYAALFA